MWRKKRVVYVAIALAAIAAAVYGQKEKPGVAEAKPYVPQPLIVLDGGTIQYNDAPDCH